VDSIPYQRGRPGLNLYEGNAPFCGSQLDSLLRGHIHQSKISKSKRECARIGPGLCKGRFYVLRSTFIMSNPTKLTTSRAAAPFPLFREFLYPVRNYFQKVVEAQIFEA
jgi:hypothetical protein